MKRNDRQNLIGRSWGDGEEILSHKEEQQETTIDFLVLSQCHHHIVFVLTAPTTFSSAPFRPTPCKLPNE
jgi:hypothetical protein